MFGAKNRTVYSTESDIPLKDPLQGAADRKVLQPCVPALQQRVCVSLDKKGRGGKSVTLIAGEQMTPKEMEALLKQLKTRFGTGGAVKDKVIEIQGDHRDAIISVLEGLGYRPKRAGG
jgi:translation initiation factor 1